MPVTVQGEVSIVNWQLGQRSFRRSDDNSEQMAIDGRATGTPVVVWNGTGASDTGGDWTHSGIGSESASAKYSGTNGLDTGLTAIGNNINFDNGSMIDVDGTYSEVTFWMNPQAYPGGSVMRVLWLDSSNTIVGNNVRVDDYATNMDTGVWQKVSIPISDFNLTGNVQKLRLRFLGAANQDYYLDDFELVPPGGGGPYRFQVAAPDANTIYHISMLVLMIAEDETGWDDTKFSNITALTNGLLLRQRDTDLSEDNILWRFNSKDNVDLFGRYHPQETFTFNNGKLLAGFMVKPGQASVNVTNTKILEFLVRDDLSSISSIRAYAHYGVEVTNG